MRRRSGDGTSQQQARLLRVPTEEQGAPVTAMVWDSVGGAVPSGPAAMPENRRSQEAPPFPADPDTQERIEAARQQGRVEGETAGAQRANQRLDPLMTDLSAMLAELARLRPRLRSEAEEDTVKLALAIARRVLHRELSADPEAVLGLVKAAFQKLSARETHRLRVAPQDAAVIEEHRTRLHLPADLEVASDASLPRGSAVFETSRGELDASVDTQIAEIEHGLTDLIRRQLR